MNETERIYQELKKKRADIQKRLGEIQSELNDGLLLQKSIVVKKINGKQYYYSQWREDGRLHTKYLCPVSPGAAAQEELRIERRKKLLLEREEQQRLLKYAEQVWKSMENDRRKEKILEDYSFEVFWKNELTARVSVQGSRVKVSRYTDHPLRQLFADTVMTRQQLNRILELRCWDKDRPDILQLLGGLGLTEYNPLEIVRRTHGVTYNDYVWFRFPGEELTCEDVLVR